MAAQGVIADEVSARGAFGALIALIPGGRGVMAWDAQIMQAAWRDGDRIQTKM
jgi:hypothetical protein